MVGCKKERMEDNTGQGYAMDSDREGLWEGCENIMGKA